MINRISLFPVKNLSFTSKPQRKDPIEKNDYLRGKITTVPFGNTYNTPINKAKLNTPLDNIIFQATNGVGPKYDDWTEKNIFCGTDRPDKKWVFSSPANLLKRSLKDAINSNLTLVYGNNIPHNLPDKIETPNYGDNWGRYANYIEINNRAIGDMLGDRTNSSILNTIKLLPLIPPSHDKWANCILISQLYPNIYGDGWNNNGLNSLYGLKFEFERKSDNIGHEKIGNKWFTSEEQIKAFNDLAHLRGFKTSFRMLVSEDQMKIGYSDQFRWDNPNHVEAFIIACCKGIELGFDGIFFDSIKHVGGYDLEHYAGVGKPPSYEQMQHILYEIRKRTGRHDLSFSGEKATDNYEHFKNMGLTAGAGWGNAANIDEIKRGSWEQRNNRDFAYGPVVTDDNDGIHPDCDRYMEYVEPMRYNDRLDKIKGCLYGYNPGTAKIPTFMQMADLFPLNHGTCTHQLMMQNVNFSSDNTPESHFNNLFADDNNAKEYRRQVMNEFAHCYKYGS